MGTKKVLVIARILWYYYKCKDLITGLIYCGSDYILIESFPVNSLFKLTFIILYYIISNTLKNIIKNLPNIQPIKLWVKSVAYSKNDPQVTDLKLSI